MAIPDYTLVVGVDAYHLKQLALTWPTWVRHKPSLLHRKMVVFYDPSQVDVVAIKAVVDHPDMKAHPWPMGNTVFPETGGKWGSAQRHRMLAGFVHIPPRWAKTPYWLKLDTDVVATGNDNWMNPRWFDGDPAIVAHRWSFTKPPDQMVRLDAWAAANAERLVRYLGGTSPLNFIPTPGASRLGHNRIISWCGFFSTAHTKICSWAAVASAESEALASCLPVPSQDGFMWYMAKRRGLGIVRTNMKGLGWEHWSTEANIAAAAARAMQ